MEIKEAKEIIEHIQECSMLTNTQRKEIDIIKNILDSGEDLPDKEAVYLLNLYEEAIK